MPTIRTCNTCEQTKPITDFRDVGHNNGNRRHKCIVCERIKQRENNKIFYEKNKEKYKQYARDKYKSKKLMPTPVQE